MKRKKPISVLPDELFKSDDALALIGMIGITVAVVIGILLACSVLDPNCLTFLEGLSCK